MSYQEALKVISVGAYGDHSSNQYKFVAAGANGFTLQSTNGGFCLGVLQDKPGATDRMGRVAINGVTRVKAGAAIAKGAKIQSNSSGLAITAAFSGYVMGEALEAATAANDVIAMKLNTPTKVREGTESYVLGAPILADDDRIVTSADWADGALTIAAHPDVPRNITITVTDANASITGGTCTVVGVDHAGTAIRHHSMGHRRQRLSGGGQSAVVGRVAV